MYEQWGQKKQERETEKDGETKKSNETRDLKNSICSKVHFLKISIIYFKASIRR